MSEYSYNEISSDSDTEPESIHPPVEADQSKKHVLKYSMGILLKEYKTIHSEYIELILKEVERMSKSLEMRLEETEKDDDEYSLIGLIYNTTGLINNLREQMTTSRNRLETADFTIKRIIGDRWGGGM